jgi:hypothetical protein
MIKATLYSQTPDHGYVVTVSIYFSRIRPVVELSLIIPQEKVRVYQKNFGVAYFKFNFFFAVII